MSNRQQFKRELFYFFPIISYQSINIMRTNIMSNWHVNVPLTTDFMSLNQWSDQIIADNKELEEQQRKAQAKAQRKH